MLFRDISYLDEHFELRRGSVLVEGAVIAAITDAPPSDYRGEIIDGTDRLLIPGFYNTHCHVPMTLLRGYGEGLPLQRWLNERVFPFEERLTDEDVYYGSLVGIAEMLASGCVSFTDMYDHCESIAQAVVETGIKANLSRGIVEFGGGGLYGSMRHAEAVSLIDRYHGASDNRIICEAAVHMETTTNERVVRESAEFAKSRGLGVHIHLSETKKEHDDCVNARGVTPARYFEDCGLLDSRVTAAHCVWVTDEDIEILARHHVSAAHCPSSNMKLGSGVARLPELIERGVLVSLGTDGASSNNNLNMLEELHLMSMIHRGVRRDPELLPPSETLKIATRNGALAQGRQDCGLVKVGFRADLAVLRLDTPHMMPVHDPLTDVAFSAQSSDVAMTVVDGKIVYRDGVFAGFDVRDALNHAVKSARRIADELG
ncbi:MAG: amidohydrolase [Oscillospiraceae bacterium]|jgi:5-methylthioadenosine/S-adenosylhomocysteine deaminase|nr:amidohydrolase [Oscillospiraceae bacterium]